MRCFLTGSSDAQNCMIERIEQAVEQHITAHSVTQFVVGQYGSFDRMATAAVIRAKKKYPHIKLFILLPYHPSERAVQIPEHCDGTIFPEGLETVPRRVAIVRANQHMVMHSEYMIVYMQQAVGNTRRLLEYARRHSPIFITELSQ